KLASDQFEIDVPVDNPKTITERDRTYTLSVNSSNEPILLVTDDKAHATIFEGPVGKDDQRAKIPADLKDMLVKLETSGGQYVRYAPGQKAWVRFKMGKHPLLWQWTRRVLQLLQEKQPNPLV